MESRSKSEWFNSYLKVHESALFCCPLPSFSADTHHPPPTTLLLSTGQIPGGEARRETVSALLQNLSTYLPSQQAAEEKTEKTDVRTSSAVHAHAHTVHTHTHNPRSRYLRFEIINANRAAAHRGGGGRQTKGQLLHANRRETSKENWRGEGKCVHWTKIFCPGGGNFILLTLYHLFVIQRAIKIPWQAGGKGGGLMREKVRAKKTGRQNSEWMWLAARMSPRRECTEKSKTPRNLIISHFFCFVLFFFSCERNVHV